MPVLQEIKVPLVSVNDRSLTIIETCFSTGDTVHEGDVILVFETSKTTYDVEASVNGYVQYLCVAGEDYEVDAVIALIFSSVSEVQDVFKINKPGEKTDQKKTGILPAWVGKTLFSKGALELINANGINEKVFAGQDFVNKKDVLLHLENKLKKNQPGFSLAKKTTKPIPGFQVDETNLVVKKLPANKKREIEYLSSVQSNGLTSTINTFINTDGIFVHLNESLKALKNSLLPVTIYETSRLLQKYKEMNAFYSDDAIYYYGKINIGFAIDLDQGLKVLKVHGAQHKSIGQIEEDIIDLSGRYLDNSLHYEDMTDITFTITDLSSENVAFFRPLVNFMNSAILGISSIDEKLQRCIYTVAFDHRVTEGKFVSGFLKDLKGRLESYQSNHFARRHEITCFKCFRSLEEDLSDVGFSKCITPQGEDAFICQSCLKGF
jgi:pyruvate/2-oxoglutarate dehydrogenase complex dihydrolipoamide acyltransferase (E2) component